MKRNSLLQFETSQKQLGLSSINIPQTLNEIGKTILNFDITDNINKIQKRRVEQRKEDQTKYQKEQEEILKKKLIKQNDAQIILEDMKKNEEIKEDFKVDVSSLYFSMKEQFPLFSQSNNQNQWQSIAKVLISTQSAQVSPDNSQFIEMNSKRRSIFSNYNANNLEKSFESLSNLASVKQRVSFYENVITKEKENKISQELDQKQQFFSHVISSNYIESALKNKTQNQIKFRRIKLGSLEKEVKFNIIENQQENCQLIQRNRFVPKIFLDKQIILFENSQQKIPSYHPQIQKNKKTINLNILNSKVPSRRQSLIFYSLKNIQDQAQIDKQYQKLIQFRSENTLEYQKAQNTLLFDLIFDNKQLNNTNKSKHGKGQKQRTPKIKNLQQPDEDSFKAILKNVTKDNVRRKSCHCSECGDVTSKQKLSQMVVLNSEKKSPVRVQSFSRVNKKNNTSIFDSPNNYLRLGNQNKNLSMLSNFQPEKISSQQQTQLSINSKQSNETPKFETANNQDEFSCMVKSQNKTLSRQNSLGLLKVQNLDQSRYRTDTQDTDRFQDEMSEFQQLKIRTNKSFFIKIEALKRSQQAQRNRAKENNQAFKSYSPSKLKLKLILKNDDKNYVLNKFLNERQQSSRRIEEFARRQVVSQYGFRNVYKQPQFSNNSEKQEYLKQANKIFLKNTKKNVFLKKLDEKSDTFNKIQECQNIQTARISTADPHSLLKYYKKNKIIENFLTNRESITRKSSDFNSKAYSSQSTFNSTKGFSREKKYLNAFQDEINSKHS
ncbi:hypothetical protein ABPG72_006057 [Tetrahymena utriculariae]